MNYINNLSKDATIIVNQSGKDWLASVSQIANLNSQDIFKYTNQQISSEILNFWPGPLTVIVANKFNNNQTIALRCPNDDWLRKVISLCGVAIFSTSVNLSGCDVLEDEQSIIETFGNKADLIVLDGDKKGGVPSTIVKINDNSFEVIRQGALKI
jgi:L-threonylcarbamoyladenylate synthase